VGRTAPEICWTRRLRPRWPRRTTAVGLGTRTTPRIRCCCRRHYGDGGCCGGTAAGDGRLGDAVVPVADSPAADTGGEVVRSATAAVA